MYEAFFKLRSRPFIPAPQTATYFPATVIENARRTLSRAIERAEGPGLIVGPPGTGKTLLCQLLAEQFGQQLAVATLSSGRLKTCQALLQAILYELGLPYRGLDEGELRLALMEFLEPKIDGPQGLLLLVDEAHTLPWRLLDEIRLILNLVRDGQPRVRAVLAGASSLEEHFASPKLGSFSQRIAARCNLEPLDGVETAEYVRAQLAAAGGDPVHLVTDEALRSVYRVTDGIPRLINQVCDHALILTSLGGHQQLNSDAIEEAWADLQQLPAPWDPASKNAAAGEIVEFGNLQDSTDELPEAIPFRSTAIERSPQLLHTGEPDEQIDAIANQLSTIEAGQPSASAEGTEADLDFPEFSDPFGEQFAEEEVVVDRYYADVEIFADVPRVSSWEGQQLGSLLEEVDVAQPWLKDPPRAQVRVTEPQPDEVAPRAPAAASGDAGFTPASDPVLPEESPAESAQTVEFPAPTPALPAGNIAKPRPRPLDQLAGVASDRDRIVVEDDAPRTAMPPAPTTPPRKGEFRQLFAKLRRG